MTRGEIITYVESLIGIRYRHQGRIASNTLDCLGLICAVGDHFGIDYVDLQGYSRNPNPEQFRDHFRRYTAQGSVTNIRDGSIGVFRQGQFPSHLAIFNIRPSGQLAMIHALLPAKRVLRQGFGKPYTDLLVEVREFPGVED